MVAVARVLRAVAIGAVVAALLAVAAIGVAALDGRFTAGRFTIDARQCPLATYREQTWPDCPPAVYSYDGS